MAFANAAARNSSIGQLGGLSRSLKRTRNGSALDPKRASIGNIRRVCRGIIHLKVRLIGTKDAPNMQTSVSPGAITWCFRVDPPRFARDAHVGR